jgi:hypothetical protein
MEILSQLDYLLLKDTYAGGAITLEQAHEAFATNTPISVTNIVAPGSSDASGNVLPNGGFYTGTQPTVPLYTDDGFNNVLIIRRRSADASLLTYLYFYIRIPQLGQQ